MKFKQVIKVHKDSWRTRRCLWAWRTLSAPLHRENAKQDGRRPGGRAQNRWSDDNAAERRTPAQASNEYDRASSHWLFNLKSTIPVRFVCLHMRQHQHDAATCLIASSHHLVPTHATDGHRYPLAIDQQRTTAQ